MKPRYNKGAEAEDERGHAWDSVAFIGHAEADRRVLASELRWMGWTETGDDPEDVEEEE
jgi:hypothetical protein